MKQILQSLLDKAIDDMIKNDGLEGSVPEYTIEVPNNSDHGDFASNIAMKSAKIFRTKPMDIANRIVETLKHPMIKKSEAVMPGFINFFIDSGFYHDIVKQAATDDAFFKSDYGQKRKVMVEFVSANPTGPLHVGHGRNAAYGDSLSKILAAAGFDVTTEYYVNDAGNQMNNLGKSIYIRYMELSGKDVTFPEDGYHGEYIIDIAKELKEEYGDKIAEMPEAEGTDICFKKGLKDITDNIANTLKNFKVDMETYFSEQSLYDNGDVPASLEYLKEKGFVFENEGALWFKSTEFGDDKDRVVKRSNGDYTYFASDIAYHKNKFDRGFMTTIDVWGADHHGYVKRLSSAIDAIGYEDREFAVSLIQMVNLVNAGERVSMSTRAGSFIELDWLINEVGHDAARYFYSMRDYEAQFDFDISLAKKRESDNPVFYIQYGHARVQSVLKKAQDDSVPFELCTGLEKLNSKEELEIIKKVYDYINVLEQAARNRQPHRIGYYLQELASMFHSYYFNNKMLNEQDKELTSARLTLAVAVGNAIRNGLSLLGVSAPDRM
ncbi:MAG: arginine--tRNA ligase [Denitrovibrio sp.]|nr:MAG: arginine--tRNA ligase [Denitrovibrio sp.]